MREKPQTIVAEQLFSAFAEQLLPSAQEIDLPDNIFSDPDMEIPESKFVELLELTAEKTKQNIGLEMGSKFLAEHIGAVGYAFINAESIEQSLLVLQEYSVTYSHFSQVNLQRKDALVMIDYQITDPTIIRKQQDAEFAIAAIWHLINTYSTNHHLPVSVEFSHSRPLNTNQHRQLFNCPIRFNCERNRIIFDQSVLKSTLINADKRLFKILLTHLAQQKLIRETNAFKIKVNSLVAKQLTTGEISINKVSDELKISIRTLQRRLKDLDLDFSTLVNNVRKDLALQHIKNPKLTISKIAELLAYSETSVFTRAFKRWTGKTPNHYRRTLL